jgi:cell division inhibitor SepF
MAGAMRKMAVYLGLVEDDRYEEYDEYDDHAGERDDRDHADRAERRTAEVRQSNARTITPVREQPPQGSVATMADRRPAPAPAAVPTAAPEPTPDLSRITTIHPRTYNEAKAIGEAFRDGTPVIMNLTEMDDADAKRLVDFAAGLVFALRGTIERVTNKVFLLSPANVTVTAEDKARMAESGFFNQS